MKRMAAMEIDRVEAEMRATVTSSLPLPRVGITLLAPWWWYVLWAGKRVENRMASVVARLSSTVAVRRDRRWRSRAGRCPRPGGCCPAT